MLIIKLVDSISRDVPDLHNICNTLPGKVLTFLYYMALIFDYLTTPRTSFKPINQGVQEWPNLHRFSFDSLNSILPGPLILIAMYCICSNISPGFYFLPCSGDPASKQDRCLYNICNQETVAHYLQFLWTFQLSPQLRNIEKPGLQMTTVHKHLLRPHGLVTMPLCNPKYTLNCHTHSLHPAFIQDLAFIDSRAWNTPSF